ncbi:MAG TPA: hypothetical protein PKM50_06410 [Methanoregula sp.]|nr:hypothetical protein [Methanoregula sp.]
MQHDTYYYSDFLKPALKMKWVSATGLMLGFSKTDSYRHTWNGC